MLWATLQMNGDLSPGYCCLQTQVQVHMTMEISPQHHSIVLGKNSNNLKQIMQRTSTEIMFPDAGDPNIPNLKKSSVCITGTIHNVYLARQQLMVCPYFLNSCTELFTCSVACITIVFPLLFILHCKDVYITKYQESKTAQVCKNTMEKDDFGHRKPQRMMMINIHVCTTHQ